MVKVTVDGFENRIPRRAMLRRAITSLVVPVLAVSCATQLKAHGSNNVRLQLQQLGTCAVQKHRADAVTYLVAWLSEADNIRFREELLDPKCMHRAGGEQSLDGLLSGLTFQGALAEVLLSTEPAFGTPLQPNQVPPLRHQGAGDFPKTFREVDAETRQTMIAMSNTYVFGECVVRSDAPSSRSLLMTEPDSDAEAKALVTLKAAILGCVHKDHRLLADKADIRGAIAVSYYRIAHALVSQSAPGSAN